MRRQHELELGERVQVVGLLGPDDQLDTGTTRSPPRDLADGMDVLLAEVQPEPRIDELDVRRRHEDVLVEPPSAAQASARNGVQRANHRWLRGRVAGGLDPDVGAPRRVRPSRCPIR